MCGAFRIFFVSVSSPLQKRSKHTRVCSVIEKMSCPSFEKDKRLVKDDGEEEEAEVLEIDADMLPKSMSALLQLHLNIGTVRFDERSITTTTKIHKTRTRQGQYNIDRIRRSAEVDDDVIKILTAFTNCTSALQQHGPQPMSMFCMGQHLCEPQLQNLLQAYKSESKREIDVAKTSFDQCAMRYITKFTRAQDFGDPTSPQNL